MKFGSVCSGTILQQTTPFAIMMIATEEFMGRPATDLTGLRFGRLLVLERCKSNGHGGRPRWKCVCDCGKIIDLLGARLRGGSNKSCGCFRRDRMGNLYKTHGKSKTFEYCIFYDARKRAIKLGLPFDLIPDDIKIPEKCPVFGFPLTLDGPRDTRPNLDRKIPSLGYVKSNIRVISFRANRIKSDATAHELASILEYIGKP